jgi:hypothetical protein
MTWQEILVGLCVVLAAVYVGHRVLRATGAATPKTKPRRDEPPSFEV